MKKTIKWLLKLAFTISLFILIFNPRFFGIEKQFIPVTLEDLWREIKGIDLSVFVPWAAAALLIKACGIFSSMLRWMLLLKGQAIKLPFRHLFGTFLVGRFFGMFLPSTIGLDGYRLYDVAKHTGKTIESATVILIEKLTGFIGLTFLVFLTLPLGLRFLPIKPVVLCAILAVMACFIIFSFMLLFNPRIIQLLFAVVPFPGKRKFQDKLDKLTAAITAYSGQKMLLAKALLLGFCVHLATSVMYFATAMSVNTANVDILDILFASPLMIYGTVIGPSIGGEGIREIIFALILGAKAGSAKAILFAHLGFWVGEGLSFAGGIIYMLRPAEYRPKTEDVQKVVQSTTVQKEAPVQITPGVVDTVKRNMKSWLYSGAVSGVWAGFITGVVEAAVVLAAFDNLFEMQVLYWAPAAYALLGAVLGLGIGVAGCVVSLFSSRPFSLPRIQALGFVAALTPVLFVIIRFRIVRDILHERSLSVPEQAGIAAAFLVLALALYAILSLLLHKKFFKILFSGPGAPVLWAVYFVVTFGYALLDSYFTNDSGRAYQTSPFGSMPPVVLIMADALRTDHMSCYGYKKSITPNIDRFAEDGILFTHNFAQSSWTKPQTASLLTSLYPSTHNTYLKPHVLPESVITIAEAMSDMGYITGGVVSNINLSPIFNFHQGFDYYCYLAPDYYFYAEESSSKLCLYNLMRLVKARFLSRRKKVNHFYQDASVVNRKTTEWLDTIEGQPFFLFQHYMDPHDPYFAHPYDGRCIARVSTPNPPPEKAEEMRMLYDQDIYYMDQHFGMLMDYLKSRGLYESSLIIFTADHGEEFYDHGGWWHGTALFEEQIRVPLIVKLPGNRNAGRTDSRLIRSIDVAPFIINAAGGEKPESMQGDYFVPADPESHCAEVFAEEDHERNVITSIRTDRWKLILTKEGSPRMHAPVQLFDIREDPGERSNVAGQYPDVVRMLQEQLQKIKHEAQRQAYKEQKKSIDSQTQDRLKALGYVE